MLASVATFALEGVDSQEVTVEVDVRAGLPVFAIVGLPDAAVREARERVRAALLNSALEFPQKRITANLAPAHVRKAGPTFDLALAVAVLAASGQLTPEELDRHGGVRRAVAERRAPRRARSASRSRSARGEPGYAKLIVPSENAAEAALVEGIEVLGVPDPRADRRARSRRLAPDHPGSRPRREAEHGFGPRPRRRARPARRASGRSRSPPPAATTC